MRELEAENNKLKKAGRQNVGSRSHEGFAVKNVVMPAAKRPVAQHLIESFSLSGRVACKRAVLNRNAFRYLSKPKVDNGLLKRLKAQDTPHTRYGYLCYMVCSKAKVGGKLKSEPISCTRRKATKKRKELTRQRQAHGGANCTESTSVYALCIRSTQQWSALSDNGCRR